MRCLQGFQSMTQACGMLEVSDSRDAYLTSLCGYTLTDTSTLDHAHASKAEGVMSPTGGLLLFITLMLTLTACKADGEHSSHEDHVTQHKSEILLPGCRPLKVMCGAL